MSKAQLNFCSQSTKHLRLFPCGPSTYLKKSQPPKGLCHGVEFVVWIPGQLGTQYHSIALFTVTSSSNFFQRKIKIVDGT